jgi:outer membrane protein OmpA-like peptidoglycan-associated protein
MRKTVRVVGMLIFWVFNLWYAASGVATGEKIKTEGLIVSRQHGSITIRRSNRPDIVAILTDYTKIYIPSGLLRKKEMPQSSLVPGLWVKLQGAGSAPGNVFASVISFSGNDLRTANAIQAGLVPLEGRVQANTAGIQANEERIQANRQETRTNQQHVEENRQNLQQFNQRLSGLGDYDVKSTSFVYFTVGSSVLTPQARNELLKIANDARSVKGYLIQVKGYTDASGPPAINQDLSMRRALSVIAFLEETANVPLTHVLTPGAMGETRPVGPNGSPQGRAENRRAEIRILTNRGMSGGEILR